jgi:hypothetical protein
MPIEALKEAPLMIRTLGPIPLLVGFKERCRSGEADCPLVIE